MFNVKVRLAELEAARDKALAEDKESPEQFATRLGQIAALSAIINGVTPETIIQNASRIMRRYPGPPYLYRAMIAVAQEYQ